MNDAARTAIHERFPVLADPDRFREEGGFCFARTFVFVFRWHLAGSLLDGEEQTFRSHDEMAVSDRAREYADDTSNRIALELIAVEPTNSWTCTGSVVNEDREDLGDECAREDRRERELEWQESAQ